MDIGIDLGTTFSVLAVDGKVELAPDYPGGAGYYLEACDVTIIPSLVGEYTFPSVMMPNPDDSSKWLFGVDAVQKADEGLAPVMFSKRKIGTTELIPVANGMVTAKDVAARFLGYLKECAERALARPITRAVITHPAYFDRGAVEETREAARDAGFDMSLPQQMLMEPVAAALCYTRADERDPLRILTYDLGGGTFDVTYLERRGGVISMHSFDGNHLLGGYNFDLALVHSVLKRLETSGRKIRLNEDDPEDRGRLARLLRLAEEVKIKLSKTHSATDAIELRAQNVLIDEKGRTVQISERFTRAQFVETIQEYLDDVLASCRRALVKGKVRSEDLHEVLLVGGSSRGPWVMESLKTALPTVTPRLFEPDLCVGAGAAIHARMVLPRELGNDQAGSDGYKVTLDAPESTLLEKIHVAGQVVQTRNSLAPVEVLSVALCPAEGTAPAPIALAKNGRFLFQDVEMAEHVANRFHLRLRDLAGRIVYEQPFSVVQGTSPRGATTTTVLPRPLYIETSRGLVALAEEGATLPAKCVANFERSNSNPSMELRLFQEHDPVGLVQIKGIPEEAGVGAPVVLTLEITADNHVHGDVAVYSLIRGRDGNVTGRREELLGRIDVCFDPTIIPTREELEEHFENVREQFSLLPEREPDFAAEVQAEGAAQVERIARILGQQIVERQEVHLALRKLRHLLSPPKDEMSPTRLEFKCEVRQHRELLRGLLAEVQARVETPASAAADDHAQGSSGAERLRKGLTALEEKLVAVEQAGFAAHTQKNRAVWENKHAALAKIGAELENTKKRLHPDDDGDKNMQKLLEKAPFLLKMLVVGQQINPLKAVLARHASSLRRKGALEIWRGELDDINQQLSAAEQNVVAIDDESDAAQIRAKIQVVLQSVKGLKARIDRLGIDLH